MVVMEGSNMKSLWGRCLQLTGFRTLCRISSAYGVIINHTSDKLNLLDDLVNVYLAYIMFSIYYSLFAYIICCQ